MWPQMKEKEKKKEDSNKTVTADYFPPDGSGLTDGRRPGQGNDNNNTT